jgi:DNA-binding GntR family transcriptional regulator
MPEDVSQVAAYPDPKEGDPKEGEPARERVYRFVRDGILSGGTPGGTFLEEGQISLAVGVSRTPVREALSRLQAERFVELIPRRGARVREVTLQELVEVYEARRVIEIHVARSLCNARVGAPPMMARVLRDMRELSPNDLLRHVELDIAFHQAMMAASQNRVLLEIYDTLRARRQRVALTSISVEPTRLYPILEEHGALVRALDASDADAAAATLERHLQPVSAVLSRLPGFALAAQGDTATADTSRP